MPIAKLFIEGNLESEVLNPILQGSPVLQWGGSNISKTTGGKVPKRQTEEVSVRAAQDFDKFYSERKADAPEATSDILVLTVDQKGVVMRK